MRIALDRLHLQRDVVAVRPGDVPLDRTCLAQSGIVLNELGGECRQAPAVQDRVVEAQADVERTRSKREDIRTDHRRMPHIDTRVLLPLHPALQLGILLPRFQVRQIVKHQRDLGLRMHHLQRRCEAEIERGAQHGVAACQLAKHRSDAGRVHVGANAEVENIVIGRVRPIQIAVEQHARLHVAERIGILDGCRQPRTYRRIDQSERNGALRVGL